MQAKVKHFVDNEGTVVLPYTTQEAIYTSPLNLYVDCNSIVEIETGEQDTPFKTIQKAIDSIPLLNELVYIRIASGTYEEDVITGLKNGSVKNINGYVVITKATSDAIVNIKSFKCYNANNMALVGLNFYGESDGRAVNLESGRYTVHDCTFVSLLAGSNIAVAGYNANITVYDTAFTNYDSALTAFHGAVIMPNKDSVTYTGCTRKYDNVGGMASDGKSFDDYLLLAGGMMKAGAVINVSADNDVIKMRGSKEADNGASLALYGKDNSDSSLAGVAVISASNGTQKGALCIRPDGRLLINDKLVSIEGKYLPDDAHPLAHNGIFRGKNLGTITASNVDAFVNEHGIATGKFTDLYIGDYFTIQDGTYNKEWEIAGFDTYLHKGDTEFTKHHLALIPKVNLLQSYMNSTNVTTGGYVGSYMHTTVIPAINTNLAKALGSHLLTRRALLTKTVNTSVASGAGAGWTGASTDWAWYDVKACLMSEVAVYGSRVGSSSLYDIGEDCERLPIFHFKGHSYTRQWFWLRAVTLSTTFAGAGDDGHADHNYASYSDGGVRPLICFG